MLCLATWSVILRPAFSVLPTRRPRLSILCEGFRICLTLIVSWQRYTTNKNTVWQDRSPEIVSDMTCVFGGTLNLAQLLNCTPARQRPLGWRPSCKASGILWEAQAEKMLRGRGGLITSVKQLLLLRDSCCETAERTSTENERRAERSRISQPFRRWMDR